MTDRELATIEENLQRYEPQFAQLVAGIPGLPAGTAGRLIRSVMISCEGNPKLQSCTLPSLVMAATTGAVLGLEADGVTGQGFLVPFRRKGRGLIAQWMTGYKGYNTLGARVGLTIDGGVVREGDFFDFEEGTHAFIKHKKLLGGGLNRRIIAAYAQATAPGRTPIIKVMDIDELLAIKQRSQASNRDNEEGEAFSPWNDTTVGFPAMCEKTPKRRLARSLPLSAYTIAARIDEAVDEQGAHAFMTVNRELVIDGKAQTIADAEPGDPKGPGREALQAPSFLVHGMRGDVNEPTIERWRGRMLDALNAMRGENLDAFWQKNAAIMDDLRDQYPEAVRDVGRVYEERRRR